MDSDDGTILGQVSVPQLGLIGWRHSEMAAMLAPLQSFSPAVGINRLATNKIEAILD